MEITPNMSQRSRSRSRSRTRNLSNTSRSTSSTRRPSFGSRRSLSSSSLTKLQVTPTPFEPDRFIPTVQAHLDNSLPSDFFKQDILGLVKALKISKWHKHELNPAHLLATRISGALTNSIYKLEYRDLQQDLSLPSLLLRVYGKNAGSIIDRDLELKILIKLNQKKIGPRLLGIFTNGRFEQFLEGFITLNRDQIRDEVISQMIARRMKDLHYQIKLSSADKESEFPMSWKLIYKWLDILERDYIPGFREHGLREEDLFFVNFQKFKQLIEHYREWLFNKYQDDISGNFKFCHNDTQYGNLLLHESFSPSEIVVQNPPKEEDKNIVLKATSNKKDNYLAVIDFEYSGPNLPAYDLVNHFSEWMADYHDPEKSYYIDEKQYPSMVQRLNFIKSYVEYDFRYPSSNLKTKDSPDVSSASASELIEFEIKKIYNECILWRPTVQLFWCLWGLLQNGSTQPTYVPGSEQGVDGTYNITTAVEGLNFNDNAILEEMTSSDDDFNYLKYAQQKAALIIGDFINFGFVEQDDTEEKLQDIIKNLDTELYEI
ncbi:uncharacterized protein PRCAT00002339001 [Priceomyces carsonii]|uniref:uncharacterized protein n=1 Tax=Priceomyces carsonii TaxID=28549 RepID=UPI002EDA6C1C|nr:unnamed protein product [Priceomyces carsonii]